MGMGSGPVIQGVENAGTCEDMQVDAGIRQTVAGVAQLVEHQLNKLVIG